jgi:two-component system cell cycle sensor histidine kinase/response regulator CckA
MQKILKKISEDNIWRNPLLRNTLIMSLALATLLPAYDVLVIFPSFTNLLIKSTKDDTESIARHLASMLISEKSDLNEATILEDLLREIKELKINFDLKRLKVFSKSGEVLYSTNVSDIGLVNNRKYLNEVLTLGKVHSKFIHRDAESLEGQKMAVDVVEIYVPLISGGQVLGAFEIYYDITARKIQLDKLLSRSSVIVFTLAFILSTVIVLLLFKENKTSVERKRAEAEREKLIKELQDAIARINKLNGLLPICAHCKKIRDDKGYWNQIESYIREHSEAEFSHGICPECAQKLYPEFFVKK